MTRSQTISIRVRYVECDPMGVAHHSVHAVWFEIGRTELLRTTGLTYRELESQGVFLAVIELNIKYKRATRYDDELALTTRITSISRVKIEHAYELRRGEETVATATSVLACLDRDGRPRALPDLPQFAEIETTDEH